MLSDAQQNNNKVIVTYDVETVQKEVVHSPSNSQSLTFKNRIIALFPASFFGKIKAIFFQINILAFGVTGNDFNGIESQTLAK
jgi:hypothetical protein